MRVRRSLRFGRSSPFCGLCLLGERVIVTCRSLECDGKSFAMYPLLPLETACAMQFIAALFSIFSVLFFLFLPR